MFCSELESFEIRFVGNRWIKYECGALVEWHWQGKTKVLGETPPSATFSNTNLTWTRPGTNPGLPIETNKINARIIKKLPYLWKLKFNYDVQRPSPVSCDVMPCSLWDRCRSLRATIRGYMSHNGRLRRSLDIMASYFSEPVLYPLTENAQGQLPLDCYSESSFKDSSLHASGKHDTLFLCCLAT